MTIKYCDYTSGDDTTGDGSSGNPYKTIDKASTGLTGGDEVRCAKSPAHSSLSGTLTWTDGSTTVSTSQDLTGSLSAKDFVGKSNSVTSYDWWEISSINATTITLVRPFSGTSEAVASYKMGVTDTGTAASSTTVIQKSNSSGSSKASRLKISGGWDLTGPTQDGFTWFWQSGANRYGYGFSANVKTYLEFEKVGTLRCYKGWLINGSYQAGDMYGLSCHYHGVEVSSHDQDFDTVVVNGQVYDSSIAYALYLHARKITITTAIANSANGQAIYANDFGLEFGEVTVRRGNRHGLYLINHANGQADKITAEYNDEYGFYYREAPGFRVGELIANNNNTGLYAYDLATDGLIIGKTSFSGNSTDIVIYNLYDYQSRPTLRIQRYGGTAHDSRALGCQGSWIKKNSGEARSGYCLQFDPDDANYPIEEIVGISKIDSTASDITLSVYIKDDASYNGTVEAAIYLLGKKITGWTEWTPTTSYVQKTIVAATADLLLNEYLELRVRTTGTAGNLYVDDFGVS